MMKVEFIQDFYANHRFGEPLFLDWIYPANTEATEDSELLCISKHNFLKLITENATISINNPNFISVSAL
jgi:CRP-like cAMP-binding protein